MPEDLKVSQIGSSQLPTPFRGLHSPGVRKHCQIIFAYYFRKSSICFFHCSVVVTDFGVAEIVSLHWFCGLILCIITFTFAGGCIRDFIPES